MKVLGTNTGKNLLVKLALLQLGCALIEMVLKCGIVHTEKQLVEELLETTKKITGGAKL